MHPNPAFRHEDRAVLEAIVEEIGFGTVFAATPDGPRVGHAPLASTGDGALHFHLAHGNALTRHLDGITALAVVNGPDAYVSPRWYSSRDQVPTWNYIAVELEGRVRRMDGDGLRGHIETLVDRQEAQVEGGERWSLDEIADAQFASLAKGIVGFEMEIQAWRATFKLSQNKSDEDRANVAAALDAQGAKAIAHLMRTFAS
ncbi:MAG: FMN-binding negative transcriptional regulator [Novosphingobium sp.]|nr:FMN-binding negative transcriptional regulator [Novosphingobium sp.]